MYCFIEVTEKVSGEKALVSINEIRAITRQDDNNVFIETDYDVKDGSIGVCVRESYDEIKGKLDGVSFVV